MGEAKGKKKGRRAVCLPVAANGLWDPQQEGEQCPAYDDPANARMQVDKGYDKLRTFAAKHGIDVVIPVKKRRKVAGAQDKSRKKFARESVRGDRKTARTRIHSEREMIRVKNYKLL